MFELSFETHFAAAHKIIGYPGECAELHGHNWKVRIYVNCNELNNLGIAMDFKQLNKLVEDVVHQFDHCSLNELECFNHQNPTAENLAVLIFNKLKERLNNHRLKVSRVQIWESDRYSVSYSEE